MATVRMTDRLMDKICRGAEKKFADAAPEPKMPDEFYTLFAEEFKKQPKVASATKVAQLLLENGLEEQRSDYCAPVKEIRPYQIGNMFLSLADDRLISLGDGVYVSYKDSGYSVQRASIDGTTAGALRLKDVYSAYRKAVGGRHDSIGQKVDAVRQSIKVFPTLNRCLEVYPAFRALVPESDLERLDAVVVRKKREKKKTAEEIRREVLNDVGVDLSKNAMVELTTVLVADKFKEGSGDNG